MGFLQDLLKAWRLVRHGSLLYAADYERKCRIPIPGHYEDQVVMEAGDSVRVYVLRQ